MAQYDGVHHFVIVVQPQTGVTPVLHFRHGLTREQLARQQITITQHLGNRNVNNVTIQFVKRMRFFDIDE